MNVEVDFESDDVARIKLVVAEVFKIATGPFASKGWSAEMQFEEYALPSVIDRTSKMEVEVWLGMGFKDVFFNSLKLKDLFFQVRRGPDRYLVIIDVDLNDGDIEQQLFEINNWSHVVAQRTSCVTTTVLD